jgi:hypothetical protein
MDRRDLGPLMEPPPVNRLTNESDVHDTTQSTLSGRNLEGALMSITLCPQTSPSVLSMALVQTEFLPR